MCPPPDFDPLAHQTLAPAPLDAARPWYGKDPVAVITGGTRGIGLSFVRAFLAGGWQVITCARSLPGGDSPFGQLAGQYPGRLHATAADLSTREGVEAFKKGVHGHTAGPEVLIHNTGTYLPGTLLGEEEGTLEQLWAVNVSSAYHLTRALVPGMVAAGRGHIAVINSTASVMPYVNGGSYCMTKHALLGFTRVLRQELLKTGLRVTAVLPGATLTPSWDGVNLPPERFINPDELARLLYTVISTGAGTLVEELLIRPQLGDIDAAEFV